MDDFQSYLKVDLDRLAYNFEAMKKVCHLAKVAGVVKANAYGLGSVTVSRELEKLGVDYLCVANLNEAMELRNNNLYTPILVMGYVNDGNFKEVLDNNIDITAYNYTQCVKLNELARETRRVARVHVKIDTGMGRLGYKIDPDRREETIKEIKNIDHLSNLKLVGIYSHFSDADSADASYTDLQYQNFMEFVYELEQRRIEIAVKHIANDAGAIVHGYDLDMIRAGIGLYGYYGSDFVRFADKVELKPIATLYSTISYVKWLEPGEAIGYNKTFTTTKRTKVATVTIGYADGYPLALSNRAYVMVKGRKAPILGKVCMDQIMIDITDIKEVRIKDRVLIFGADEQGEITLYDLANMAGSNVYEMLCRVSMRIPRVYYRNGKIVRIVNYLSDFYQPQ